MRKLALCTGLAALIASGAALAQGDEDRSLIERSLELTPTAPWPDGDQAGMGNTQGSGTWMRCAAHLMKPGAKLYELSHLRSNDMPMSPFGAPLAYEYRPTVGIPGTRHAFNGEDVKSGEPGAQGTQMDALGHFAYLAEPWTGEGDFPADGATYYGGRKQSEVKPAPDSPLLQLGIEQAKPIVTSAVLLDAAAHLNGGEPLEPGTLVTAADIEAMLEAQGLTWRGIVPGDAVFIHTGWGTLWDDAEASKRYYTMGPGLARDGAEMLAENNVVLVALDNPFTDPVADGQLQGKAAPPQGMEEGLPFVIHHLNLAVNGIHNIQNARLKEIAADKVWTSCAIILPIRSQGASGSPVRPIAIGAPQGG
ncbi:cyclase family protein [Rhizobiales bacterium]|uniref:cyclase family protein n=1 Tax=Hongsoonwoonella zoysiae TaxID=2821844 RepID=UPI00156198DB|nr:cyclase family protein [Hongsoonwoonella zoysiae]NRG17775.1 cyclase family protein [Hongsoonwoonella zoysiae]